MNALICAIGRGSYAHFARKIRQLKTVLAVVSGGLANIVRHIAG